MAVKGAAAAALAWVAVSTWSCGGGTATTFGPNGADVEDPSAQTPNAPGDTDSAPQPPSQAAPDAGVDVPSQQTPDAGTGAATQPPSLPPEAFDWLIGRLQDVPSLQPVVHQGVVLTRNDAFQYGVGPTQERLNQLGFSVSLGDKNQFRGTFGQATEAKLKAFQAQASLPSNGALDRATILALDAAAEKELLFQPAWVQPRPSVWPKLQVPATGTLKRDDYGYPVAWLQDRLMDYGYLDPDYLGDNLQYRGTFGQWTEHAVASFQGWNGLPVTGQADAVTLNALAGVPEKTPKGRALLEGGVSIAHLDMASKAAYLKRVFDANNVSNVPFNTLPGGVNFVQIRGFAEDLAVQNVPDRYNDFLYALVNDANGQPVRVESFAAHADYAHLLYQIQYWGWGRPDDAALGAVFGPQQYLEKGLGMSSPGRVVAYRVGRHVSGSTGQNRGLGLLDPNDGSASASFAHVDFNHNGQIDGAEWKHRYGHTTINIHQSGDETREGLMSGGCHNVPVNASADYQRFAKVLLESGQVQKYILQRIYAGESTQDVYARVYGPARDGMYLPDGSAVHWGPDVNLPIDRVPVAIVDARSLPMP